MLKSEFFKKNGRLLLKQHIDASQYGSTMIFTAEELQMATEFYKKKHFFGPGGDDGSTVYDKGFLVEEPQVEHFMNGIITLTKIGHRNLVKLFGCCLETEAPLLVYELASNGTLFDHIHHTSGKSHCHGIPF